MVTLIVRVHNDTGGGLKGTVEEPGGESQVFRDVAELLSILRSLSDQAGNGFGSTSSSAIRET